MADGFKWPSLPQEPARRRVGRPWALPPEAYDHMRRRLQEGRLTQRAIAEELGVKEHHVCNYKRRVLEGKK